MAVVVVLVLSLGISVGRALLAPGTDSVAARLAEWARFHGLGWVVITAERAQYNATKPTTGGTVTGGVPTVGTTPRPSAQVVQRLAPIEPVAAGYLAGEGQWQTVTSVGGSPAIEAAFLRPDAQHTSYLVAVVHMDPKRLRFVLHPGYHVPGGQSLWTQQDQIPQNQLGTVLATFNSGFTIVDANGGYWQGGHEIAPLRKGAASMVLRQDGTIDVQAWPGGTPAAGVDAVRQNLVLLIDKGKINPAVYNPTTSVWGKTVGNATFVWRTAIGVRADGSVIFVVGPALDVPTLATLLQRAGAVRAMELDINRDWTNFLTYAHPSPGMAVPHQLTYDSSINPYRYLNPSSRDFVAVLPR